MTNQMKRIFETYLEIKSPAEAGDFAAGLSDAEAKELHDLLVKHPIGKTRLVRPLWFNYETQQYRWNDDGGWPETPDSEGSQCG